LEEEKRERKVLSSLHMEKGKRKGDFEKEGGKGIGAHLSMSDDARGKKKGGRHHAL